MCSVRGREQGVCTHELGFPKVLFAQAYPHLERNIEHEAVTMRCLTPAHRHPLKACGQRNMCTCSHRQRVLVCSQHAHARSYMHTFKLVSMNSNQLPVPGRARAPAGAAGAAAAL